MPLSSGGWWYSMNSTFGAVSLRNFLIMTGLLGGLRGQLDLGRDDEHLRERRGVDLHVARGIEAQRPEEQVPRGVLAHRLAQPLSALRVVAGAGKRRDRRPGE